MIPSTMALVIKTFYFVSNKRFQEIKMNVFWFLGIDCGGNKGTDLVSLKYLVVYSVVHIYFCFIIHLDVITATEGIVAHMCYIT